MIPKGDRDALISVAKMRSRAAKSNVAARQAELLADFEEQLATIHKANHEQWRHITQAANKMVKEADAQIAQICAERGIPEDLRPGLSLSWYGRGESADKERRAELRRVAMTRIDALGKAAKVQIETREAEVIIDLIAGGLESAEAKAALESIPTPEQLMPKLTVAEIEGTKAGGTE